MNLTLTSIPILLYDEVKEHLNLRRWMKVGWGNGSNSSTSIRKGREHPPPYIAGTNENRLSAHPHQREMYDNVLTLNAINS